jgi:cofilin
MASTGVSVSDAAIADFNEFKKSSNKTKFLIFKIESGSIVKEHASESASFDEFIALLPADDCRYAVYKMDFTTTDGRPNTKLVSIAW